METLDFEPKDYQRAFDLAKGFEALGYLEIIMPTHNDILVKLSLYGQELYETNKASFFK